MQESDRKDISNQLVPNVLVKKCDENEKLDTKVCITEKDYTGECKDTHRCHENKSQMLKTELAQVVITEDEFHTTTPIEDCFEEFAKPIIRREIKIAQSPGKTPIGEILQSSPSIQKPPRKGIKPKMKEQSQYNSSGKLSGRDSKNRMYEEATRGEATFLDISNSTFPEDKMRNFVTMTIEEKLLKFFEKQENMNYGFNSSANSSELAYSAYRKYLQMLESIDENGDSKVIRDLVMDRYGGAIRNHLDRSVSRKSIISLNRGNSKESLKSRDSGTNSIGDEFFDDDDTIPDGAFSLKFFEDILQQSKSTGFSKEIADGFLRELNENYRKYEEENFQRRSNDDTYLTKENIDSRASQTPIQRLLSQETMTTVEERSKVATEKTPDKTDTEKDLMEKLYIQTATILEVSKALNFCRKFKEYSESVERVEAEQILLIATIRRGLILDQMTEIECEPRNISTNGCVVIKDVNIPLVAIDNTSKGERYFVCVFQCGNSVLSSGVLHHKGEKDLKINKCFRFEQLSNNFEINVQLYSIFIKNSSKSKISNVILKDVNNAFSNLKRYIPTRRSSRRLAENCTMKKTCFELCGRSIITRSSLQLKEFKIQKVYPADAFASSFTCEIDSSVEVPNTASGFLTVGEQFHGTLMWNRQWCVLEKAKLSFWDYPGGENEVAPNKVLDLTRCVLRTIALADKSFCPRARTLHLKLGPESVVDTFFYTNFYLAADSLDDLYYWSEELNTVLATLISWNTMKLYGPNTQQQ